MAEKQSVWTVLNAVLGGTAAIVTAGTGLYLALRDRPPPTPPLLPAIIAEKKAQLEEGGTYDRTPWVGVELRQDDKTIKLRSVNGSWEKFEAKLAPGPFEVQITRKADGANIGILAWHDATIF